MKTESNVWVEYSKRTGVLLLAVCLLAGFSVQGAEEWSWVGGGADNLWSTEANWEDTAGDPPANAPGDFTTDDRFIIGDGHAALDGDATAGGTNTGPVIIGDGEGSDATLDILSGGIFDFRSGTYPREFTMGRDGGTGTINQSGGTVGSGWTGMSIGTSGEWDDDAEEWIVPPGVGNYNFSGGNFYAGSGFTIREGSTVEVSGGEFQLSTGGVWNGTFRVVGSEAEIDYTDSWVYTRFRPGSTLELLFDQDGVSPITATEGATGSTLSFEGGELDVGWVDEPVWGTWTVAEWNTHEASTHKSTSLSFADGVDEDIWSFEFVDRNENGYADTLKVTAIPEPSSLVLLGLTGLLLMKRRRV